MIRDWGIWIVLTLPFVGRAVKEFHEMLEREE